MNKHFLFPALLFSLNKPPAISGWALSLVYFIATTTHSWNTFSSSLSLLPVILQILALHRWLHRFLQEASPDLTAWPRKTGLGSLTWRGTSTLQYSSCCISNCLFSFQSPRQEWKLLEGPETGQAYSSTPGTEQHLGWTSEGWGKDGEWTPGGPRFEGKGWGRE